MKIHKVYFLFILFLVNNIFITITNSKGDVLLWKSIGYLKVKGLKKLTPSVIKVFINYLWAFKSFKFHIKLKGFNKFKKQIIKSLVLIFFKNILSLNDESLVPNNGCKLKKQRRL